MLAASTGRAPTAMSEPPQDAEPQNPDPQPAAEPDLARDIAHAALQPDRATGLLQRHIKADKAVAACRRLPGGSMHHVVEWTLDDGKRQVVAKVHPGRSADSFEREAQSLWLFRERAGLPAPEPLGVIRDDPHVAGAGLVMTRAAGGPVSKAKLSKKGSAYFEDQLASLALAMHGVEGAGFGSPLDDDLAPDWRQVYTPAFERAYARVRDQISSAARWALDDLVKRLPNLIPEKPAAQLVHGDLWSNNLLVDDAHPDKPKITGLIDPSPLYADVEYELAYLQLFKTVGDRFFERYNAKRPIRVGFHRRREIYWLGTMLEHVDRFGDEKLKSIEELARRAWWYASRD